MLTHGTAWNSVAGAVTIALEPQSKEPIPAMSNFRCHRDRLDLEGRTFHGSPFTASPSLWITCSDSTMNQALARALRGQPATILRHLVDMSSHHSMNTWEQGLPTIEFVKHKSVRDVVICSHSMCSCFDQHQDKPITDSFQRDECSLLARVRRRELMNDHARRQVVQQVQLWTNRPALSRQIAQGELCIHGLFYLAESGIFTRYDKSHGAFIPIMDCGETPDLTVTFPEPHGASDLANYRAHEL
jgi:carbonic anhydrase